jgi:hypothetical protein
MKMSGSMLAFTLVGLGAVGYIMGCSDKGNVNAPQQITFDKAQYVVIDYGDVQNAIEDGSIDTPMTFNTTMLGYSFLSGDRPFGPGDPSFRGMPWFDRFDFGKHLGLFFRQLNLTDDQKGQIRDLAKTFHTDMKPLVQQFYDANKDIISGANATRKVILDSLKAGSITRDQASADLKSLNQATHALIDNNPASKAIKASMCADRDILFAGIKAVLQGDQVTKWNDWISKIKNPCAP